MSTTPDTDYKAIFSHPEMVIDIITGFAPGPWLDDIDFSTLEPCKSSFIASAQEAQERHSDLIWRVRYKGSWLYVYLLFEFQSSIDPFMAIRMMVYMGLLYQDLIKRQEIKPNQKLPFVLPIVLYNGNPRWSAALATQELIAGAPQGFEKHIPQLKYFLIDEGSYHPDYLADLENLAAAIFLIETQTSMEGLHKAIARVLKWSDREKQPVLRATIAKLTTRVMRKRLGNQAVKLDGIVDLEGVCSMLEENIDNMISEGARKSRQEGLQEGRQEGMIQVLKSMLVNRYGPIPEWALDKINDASPDQLAQWCVGLLQAPSLEALFGADQH